MKIHDVKITPLKIIPDDRGKIMHMLSSDDKIFSDFGEIYFSTIFHNKVKAWHLHKESTLNYSCIRGKVKLVLFDNRNKSPSKGSLDEIILSPDKHSLITIPKNIWNGFKGLDKEESIIANCLTIPHDEKEMVRLDQSDKIINYNWDN